ncbi:uncharacterized protein LOC126744738 [Anthonomus grandis grandis]|uniref:uncharacterized protein LOC126744738 n=1 Tax=Anthonomus grandis grandis TaxID=2921223 RepID=UPI002165546C|nr:uncharacterized protein LOC126744738 [Anthonomus grandis grandis]
MSKNYSDDFTDILQELTQMEIVELCKQYQVYKDELPYLYSFLNKCIKSKTLGLENYVKIYSPGQCWREDGTFVAYMPDNGQDIVLHSFDSTGKNLLHAIRNTKRFKFLQDPARDYTCFFAVHEQFYGPLCHYLFDVSKHESPINELATLFCLRKEKVDTLQPIIPSDVYVRKLLPEDIQVIVKHWPFTYPAAELKLKSWLELSTGYGVFLQTSNQLVSWVTSSCLGQLSALQTLEGFKRKGYAALAIAAMAKELAQEGFDCCGTTQPGNTAAEKFFTKLGFSILGKAAYIAITNKY